ncbi:hypothetical protein D3C81_317950 [compost metagenome]
MTQYQYIGEDVIGQAGQNLTTRELIVLAGLADGLKPSEVAARVGVERDDLGDIESAIRAKLGAKSKPHMIARGFVLGVLIPRCLSLLLAMTFVAELDHSHDLRNRTQRRSREANGTARVIRSAAPSTAGGSRLYA